MKLFRALCLVVAGLSAGVLAMDIRSDWRSNTLLASLQAECRDYMGPKAVLVYNEGQFGCMPIKEEQ